MTQATAINTDRTAIEAMRPSWLRLLFWVVLFQLAWYFRPLQDLLLHGAMADPDDFLRLHEVRNWLAGQGWYDVSVPRMNPPEGGDLHWSRLIDLPIALLTVLLSPLVGAEMAARLAAAIWPTTVLCLTLATLIAICERAWPKTNPFVVILFALTNIAALAQFAPGRIDHHNVQILLVFVMLLGMMSGRHWLGHAGAGFCMVLSLAIGLDNLPFIALLLGWLALAWVFDLEDAREGLLWTAAGIVLGLAVLYPLSVPLGQWMAVRCDALSIVYVSAMALAAAGFAALGFVNAQNKAMRFALAGLVGAGALAVTALAFPECRAGPYSALSAELTGRWLSQIHEARGIVDFASRFGAANYALLVYIALLLAAGIVLVRRRIASSHLLPVLAVLAICLVLSFLQVRALRLGVFAAVPVCVILADLAWRHFSAAPGRARAAAMFMTGLSALFLISPVWLVVANAVLPPPGNPADTAVAGDAPEWSRQEYVSSICNRDTDFSFLATLPPGLVLNDLNTGPAILVFTGHSVVAGNYHRNGRAILETMDFFAADEATARKIATRRKPQYVAYCQPLPVAQPSVPSKNGSSAESIGRRILDGREPAWLQRISPAADRLKVYRVASDG
ncbi:MAG: hypothetical protein KDJ64_00605 [Nitratireductor sp.]|nr:hypothetical protein [Nitratireductor sp.]